MWQIDHANSRLVKVNTDVQTQQVSQLRSQLGNVDVECSEEGTLERYDLSARGTAAVLSGEVYVTAMDGLSETAYEKYTHWSDRTSLFSLPLDQDKVISKSSITLNLAGNVSVTAFDLLEAEKAPLTPELTKWQNYQR